MTRAALILLTLMLTACSSPFSDTFTVRVQEWDCANQIDKSVKDLSCPRREYFAEIRIIVNKATQTASVSETTRGQGGWSFTRNHLITNCAVVDEENWRCEPFEMLSGVYRRAGKQGFTGWRYWLNWIGSRLRTDKPTVPKESEADWNNPLLK